MVLLECLQSALRAVDSRSCVRAALAAEAPAGDWRVIAIGKAAGAMTMGAFDVLAERMNGALVISKPAYFPPGLLKVPGVEWMDSAHPEPDQRSLEAGQRLESLLSTAPRGERFLFLISGGASSLVEALRQGVDLDDLQRLNHWALSSGWPIEVVNDLRRRISRIKGGGLARWVGDREAFALMVSDVDTDDPAVIGSGLLHESAVTIKRPAGTPAWIEQMLKRAAGRDAGGPALRRIRCRIVAGNRTACRAAGRCGERQGLRVRYGRSRFSGDAQQLGKRFARTALQAQPGTLWVWGGESTVVLPPAPGRGGRNQHLALSAATGLAGHSGAWLLAAGTDGADGSSDDAGALVDGQTIARGSLAGLDPQRCLREADSGRFLQASGDLVHTGPTLTNVGDLVLALKLEAWS